MHGEKTDNLKAIEHCASKTAAWTGCMSEEYELGLVSVDCANLQPCRFPGGLLGTN